MEPNAQHAIADMVRHRRMLTVHARLGSLSGWERLPSPLDVLPSLLWCPRLHARLRCDPPRAVVQGAKLRDAVWRKDFDEVHAILTAAGPANASYLVQETEPPMPKWDRPCSARGSTSSSEEGYTAVHLAVKRNHVPILDALLEACPCAVNSEVERGYSDHQVKKGLTPIMVAARHGYADVVRELVGKGAALNDKLENGKTALLFAAAKGHSGALAALLQEDKSTTLKDATDMDARDHNGAAVPNMWLIVVTLLACQRGCCACDAVLS